MSITSRSLVNSSLNSKNIQSQLQSKVVHLARSYLPPYLSLMVIILWYSNPGNLDRWIMATSGPPSYYDWPMNSLRNNEKHQRKILIIVPWEHMWPLCKSKWEPDVSNFKYILLYTLTTLLTYHEPYSNLKEKHKLFTFFVWIQQFHWDHTLLHQMFYPLYQRTWRRKAGRLSRCLHTQDSPKMRGFGRQREKENII